MNFTSNLFSSKTLMSTYNDEYTGITPFRSREASVTFLIEIITKFSAFVTSAPVLS